MPNSTIRLNDGRQIPQIGYGTSHIPQSTCVDLVELAVEQGFAHIDTAQIYGNETQVGLAIKESALKREEIWVTTKWSKSTDSPADAISASLANLGLPFVDLYLVHGPRLILGRLKAGWQEVVELQRQGKAISIGVSNFTLAQMKELLEGEKPVEVTPAVNQIEMHPYIWHDIKDNVKYCLANGVNIEAYSPLKPLTTYPGGPLDKPLLKIATRLNAKPEQVLLAWVKAKGAISLTTSRKKERIADYVAAGSLKLTEHDIAVIDKKGKKGPRVGRRIALRVAVGVAIQVSVFCLLKVAAKQVW
ncbi:MAG: hypothetical protein CYPHOPRED_001194 [Cyphobasidiales sp. Tagirdzhanova-0007]|nr:MAG: hypothetical protein CYPHOPRED_001194 [Cyphobasidiales sp. Tagirdzhanova-0007]